MNCKAGIDMVDVRDCAFCSFQASCDRYEDADVREDNEVSDIEVMVAAHFAVMV